MAVKLCLLSSSFALHCFPWTPTGSFAGVSRSGMSEVAYMPVATATGAQAYTPMQAFGHVMGIRQETTDGLVTSMQKAVSKLQGSLLLLRMESCSGRSKPKLHLPSWLNSGTMNKFKCNHAECN